MSKYQLICHLHNYSPESFPFLGCQPAIIAYRPNFLLLQLETEVTQPAQSGQGEIYPLFFAMIALNCFSHPLWLSAEENVCFFSLYSVRVDGDQPRGPSSDHSSEKHPRSWPLVEAGERRCR